MEQVAVKKSRRERFCLEAGAVKQTAATILRIAQAYRKLFGYRDIDTEFAVAGEPQQLYMLQCRPAPPRTRTRTVLQLQRAPRADRTEQRSTQPGWCCPQHHAPL